MAWRSALAFGLALLAGPASTQVAGDPVHIESGDVAGVGREGVRAYLGVPYAAPPVGELRWRPPQRPVSWTGVRTADAVGPVCPQRPTPPDSLNYEVYGAPPQSEDCLTLNIWAPAGGAKRPVMVWIHGGSFDHGAGSYPTYEGARLAARGVVVVSLNYRVGALGFMAHPDLTTEGGGASGAYGFLDQMAALEWVKRNISAFGGDPQQVTIFGQSAGAGGVYALMASPLSRGLFHRAIGESLGLFNLKSMAEGEANGLAIAAKLGASSLAELRRLPAERFLEAGIAAPPLVDGRFLTAPLAETFAAGGQAQVPLLTGWNADEGSTYPIFETRAAFRQVLNAVFGANADRAAALYPTPGDADAALQSQAVTRDVGFAAGIYRAAQLQARAGQPVYLYHFTRKSPFRPDQHYSDLDPASRLGAYHGAEVPYVFGTLDTLERAYAPKDLALSEAMQSYWVNFARTGDPNGPGVLAWPRYRSGADGVLRLGDTVGRAPVPDLERLEFINAVPLRTPGG